MPLTYVHLSDIHFGQEKGAELIIHDDVKDRLVEDAKELGGQCRRSRGLMSWLLRRDQRFRQPER